jgi:hypothetical protein
LAALFLEMVPKAKARNTTYTAGSMTEALRLVKNEGWSLYKVSKPCDIPWSTLKDYTKKFFEDPARTVMAKIGKPFVMPSDIEIKGTTLQTGGSRVRFPMVPLEFFSGIILSVALWPWGRLSL